MNISPISKDDQNFIETALDMAFEIIGHYKKDWKGEALTPAILDYVFGQWLDAPSAYQPNVVANSLGAAFGNVMVQNLGMKWVTITDQYGTAMGVHRENPNWTSFPFDAVRKRIASKERAFFQTIYELAGGNK